MKLPRTLFSEQRHDLTRFVGRIDRSLGTYAHISEIADALNKLYDDVLHEDQVIWCSLGKPPRIPLDDPQYLHTIRPHSDDVVAVLDEFVWENILGGRCVPSEVRSQLWSECCRADVASRQELLDQRIDEYLDKHLPADPWANVVAPDGDCPMPVYLLRWPFRQSVIVDVESYCASSK